MRKFLQALLDVGNPDPEAFFKELQKASRPDGKYTNMDRYRDFREVFMVSDAGKRVLNELFMMTHIHAPSIKGDSKVETVYVLEGERNIGLKLMSVLNCEPSRAEAPTRTVGRKPTN
jgi:hypothetical protein